MPESVTMDEFLSAIDEIATHRRQTDHTDCDLCKWMECLPLSFKAFMCNKKNLDNLTFFYIGIKIGRRQAYNEAMNILDLPPLGE